MLVLPSPPNADTLKKEEKKIEKTMKTQSISKIKYKIKADNNKEIIDLKKIKGQQPMHPQGLNKTQKTKR